MNSDKMNSEKAPEPVDSEYGHNSPNGEGERKFSIGHLSENREDDFMTRNGLNLRSFQRRQLSKFHLSRDLTDLRIRR